MGFKPKDKEILIKEGYELYNKEGHLSLIDEYDGYMESLGEGIDGYMGFNEDNERKIKILVGDATNAIEEVLDLIEDTNYNDAQEIAGYVEKTNDEYNVEGDY